MQKKEILSDVIYKELVMRILEGEYRDLDTLPPMALLRREYDAGENTIRKVLHKLKSYGMITTSRGKPAKIIRSSQEQLLMAQAIDFYEADAEIFLESYKAISIMFPSIYTYASINCSNTQMLLLSQIIQRLSKSDNKPDIYNCYYEFFKVIMRTIKNPVILEILKAVLENVMLPTVYGQIAYADITCDTFQIASLLTEIYKSISSKDEKTLKKLWTQMTKCSEELGMQLLKHVPTNKSAKKVHIQRIIEYKYFLIAHDIYLQIMDGRYCIGDFLPKIADSQAHYQVAAVTVRKAYSMLNDLGIVETRNGLGTKVILKPAMDTVYFSGEEARSRMGEYMNTIEFMKINCLDVISKIQRLPVRNIISSLESTWNQSHRYSIIILCNYLVKGVLNFAVQEIYEMLSRRLYWGVYLISFPPLKDHIEDYHTQCINILLCFEKDGPRHAALLFRTLFDSLWVHTKEALDKYEKTNQNVDILHF